MITPNAIQYTWNQIFDRLGIRVEKNLMEVGNQKLQFHYCKPEEAQLDPLYLHLVISPGNPENLNRICDSPDFHIKQLSKTELLPSNAADLPVNEMPILFWGETTSKQVFGEIKMGGFWLFSLI